MNRHKRAPRSTGAAAHRAGRDAFTIATAAPQVIQMRVARMAAHGMNPSASDRHEMHRMSSEKVAAFSEGLTAMAAQALRVQQTWCQQWFQMVMSPVSLKTLTKPATLFSPGASAGAKAYRMADSVTKGMAQVAAVGLAPVSRTVSSNVKRLNKSRSLVARKR